MPHFFRYTSVVKQKGGMRHGYYHHCQDVMDSCVFTKMGLPIPVAPIQNKSGRDDYEKNKMGTNPAIFFITTGKYGNGWCCSPAKCVD